MARNNNKYYSAMLKIVLSLVSVAYPLLWYYGRQHGWFVWLALGMAILWCIRAATSRVGGQRWLAMVIAAFFVVVCLCGRVEAMYWYPVAVSALMLALFGGSLFTEQSVIERLARLSQPDLPPSGVRYTRRVTQIWCVFFVFNGLFTAILVFTSSWHLWALYSGVIAYVFMGLLLAGEWLFRRYVLVRAVDKIE